MREARYRLIEISIELVADWLQAVPYSFGCVITTNCPKDLEVVSLLPHPQHAHVLVAKCWSSEFSIVADGELIPEYTPVYTQTFPKAEDAA